MNRLFLISVACLIVSFSLQAQMANPNDELKEKYGLTDRNIEMLCFFAEKGGFRIGNDPIEPIFSLMLKIDSQISNGQISYESFATRADFEAYIGKRWTEVYSCVYCEGNGVTHATLDGIALYNETNVSWVYELYNKENNYNVDINSIRVFNHIRELEFTLYDFLTDLANVHPDAKVKKYPGYKAQLLKYAKELRDGHGAKSITELEKGN